MIYMIMAESKEIHFVVAAFVVGIVFLCSIILQSKNILHMLQLSSYNVDQYKIWKKKNKKFFSINTNLLIFLIAYILFLIIFFLVYQIYGDKNSWTIVILYIVAFPFLLEIVVSIFCIFFIIKFFKNRKKKKELKYTDRIKRNILCNALIYIALIVLIVSIFSDSLVMFESFFMAVFLICAPSITYLSFRIMLPIENGFKKSFMKKGSERLRQNINTRVVGITGSFGKTSVKNFLYQVLIKKYNTCKTPESYNTPMGVVITINEHLKSYDDIFICEMGARRIGDIKEICDIVHPTDAIVTEVGPMHLDTFLNIENVLKTKMELVDSVVESIEGCIKCDPYKTSKDENIILLNGDNEYIRRYVSDKNYDIVRIG
ncbi:MAG: hypothetical protein MJ151_03615, partial [Lachnospiraceae bacterium]|nr:hypothetical protein [Lachnospiraceae bacterium]